MGFSIVLYLTRYGEASETFTKLRFPTFLIYPLALAKFLGVVALWSKFRTLREWAYAGFTFNLLLANGAHLAIGDGDQLPTIVD